VRNPLPGILQAGLRGVCVPDNPFTSTHEVKDERQWREKKIDQYLKLPTYITSRFIGKSLMGPENLSINTKTTVADPGMFIPDTNFFHPRFKVKKFPDPHQRIYLSLTQKIFSRLSEI
jgi:hypothetical protein